MATICTSPWPAAIRSGGCGSTVRRSALTPATAERTSSTDRCCPAAYQPGFASFAQPSGLAGDGAWLYVADSEGSSIRAVPLDPRAEVRTVVGTSQLPVARLFTFGDVDGPAAQARFQHPLGVAFHEGRIYVADTYNNKIRVVDPADGTTRTLACVAVRLQPESAEPPKGGPTSPRRSSSRPGWPWRQASSSWPIRTITSFA